MSHLRQELDYRLLYTIITSLYSRQRRWLAALPGYGLLMKTGKRQKEKISDLKYRRALIPGFMIRGDF